MEELEGLNESEFQWYLDHLDELITFMQSENNRALLTPEQLAAALVAIGE